MNPEVTKLADLCIEMANALTERGLDWPPAVIQDLATSAYIRINQPTAQSVVTPRPQPTVPARSVAPVVNQAVRSVNAGTEGQLMDIQVRSGVARATGKSYVVHDFIINTATGNVTASTFDQNLIDAGKQSVGQLIRANIVPGKKQGSWNIESFELVQQ